VDYRFFGPILHCIFLFNALHLVDLVVIGLVLRFIFSYRSHFFADWLQKSVSDMTCSPCCVLNATLNLNLVTKMS